MQLSNKPLEAVSSIYSKTAKGIARHNARAEKPLSCSLWTLGVYCFSETVTTHAVPGNSFIELRHNKNELNDVFFLQEIYYTL